MLSLILATLNILLNLFLRLIGVVGKGIFQMIGGLL